MPEAAKKSPVEAPQVPAAAAAPSEPVTRRVDAEGHVERHDRAGWIERASWFTGRHKRHALAGALSHLKAEEELTQVEAQRLLDKFLHPGGKS